MSYVTYSGLKTERPNVIFNEIQHLIDQGASILELGCGEGDFAVELFLNFGDSIKYLGIDIEPELISVCQLNVESYHFKVFDLNRKEKITDDKVDIVVALGLAHPKNSYTWLNIKELYDPRIIVLETRDSATITDVDFDYYKTVFPEYERLLSPNYKKIMDISYNHQSMGFNSGRRMVVYEQIDNIINQSHSRAEGPEVRSGSLVDAEGPKVRSGSLVDAELIL